MDNIIDVTHLSKSFSGKPAVTDLSLQVKTGEIFGFLGPNGSGKTTTIRMICGLITPDSGSGRCLGHDILRDSSLIKPLIGYVPQQFCLYQDLTVKENLQFIARVYTLPNVSKSVDDMIQELELTPYKNILAGKLSGGWKQRLSLAAALVHDPKLLLLDEPTAGVDPKARREFWDYITMLSSRGISTLVSTHYMDEAERCNRLAYIVYGTLMAEGTIPDIKKQADLYTYATGGASLSSLRMAISKVAGVEQAVIYGNELRVCSRDESALKNAIAQFPNDQFQKVETSLEEVFIYFVSERTEIS